jgi:hypothetical protein
VDALAGLLDGPRARRAFLLRSFLERPWALRIQDEAPLTLIAMVRGEAWLLPDDAGGVALGPGDVAVVKGPGHYTVADGPHTAPQVVIHPGQRCATPDGEDMHEPMRLGVRAWGNDPQGSTRMLTGTYQLEGEITRRLLDVLPALVVVSAASHAPLISLLDGEMARDEPGQEAVLDRLLDLLLIAVLRAWFNRPDSNAPAWYLAHGDPIVGPVPPDAVQQPVPALDGGPTRCGRRRVAGSPGPALHGPGRTAAHPLPRRVAARPRRRPAEGARCDAGRRRSSGWLREPLRAQHGLQAGEGDQPQGVSQRSLGGWCETLIWQPTVRFGVRVQVRRATQDGRRLAQMRPSR